MHSIDFQETEIKFLVSDLAAFEKRLKSAGAVLQQSRMHELNLRFDTPQRSLTSTFQVLRLRQDQKVRLTYKGASDPTSEVSIRPEIEFEVSSLPAARLFLEALGYQVVITYEKYRTIYSLGQVEIDLDEMPYGNFIEIEARDQNIIQETARYLGLNWENRIKLSYLAIFNILKEKFQFTANNLLFNEFADQEYSLHGLFQEGLVG